MISEWQDEQIGPIMIGRQTSAHPRAREEHTRHAIIGGQVQAQTTSKLGRVQVELRQEPSYQRIISS